MPWTTRTVVTPPPPLEPLLKVRDVAAAWSLAPKTVWKWIACGHVRAIRLPSGDLRIPASEVQRLSAPADHR